MLSVAAGPNMPKRAARYPARIRANTGKAALRTASMRAGGLVQLQPWLGAALDQIGERGESDPEIAMQRQLVLLVEGEIDQPGDHAFEHHAAQQIAHEIADGAVAEGDQRAVIAIDEAPGRLAGEPPLEAPGQQHRLLISGLGPG